MRTSVRLGMNPQQLATLITCLFLIGSAEVVAGPMMAHMGAQLGVPSGAIAYLPAAYGLTYGVAALLIGPVSDRLGRKRPLQMGLVGMAFFLALMPWAGSLVVAVWLSALTGFCAAIVQPNALSLVADLGAPSLVGRDLGRVFMGLMTAFVLTPILAGWLADHAGWAAAYWGLSAVAGSALVAVSMVFRVGLGAPPDAAPSFWAAHRAAWQAPGVRRRLAISYLWLGWVAGFGAVVAEVAARRMPLSPSQAGLMAGLWGMAVVAGNLTAHRAQSVLGRVALPAMATVSAVGVLLFLLPWRHPWQLALAGLPWAMGYGCAGPLHHAHLSALSAACRGTINSYHASLLNLGICSVSALMGVASPVGGATPFCLGVAVVSLCGAAVTWRAGCSDPPP